MDRKAFFDAIKTRIYSGSMTQAQVAGVDAICDAWDQFGDGDPNKLAYCLATAQHETGRFRYDREVWGPTAAQKRYEGRADLGNTTKGDGFKFLGRGYSQITGRRNYRDWGSRLNLDLLGHPEHVSTPSVAARILVQGSMLGTFTGKKLGNYIVKGSTPNFREARRVINGTDKADMIAGYAKAFAAAVKVASVTDADVGGLPFVDYSVFERGKVYPKLRAAQKLLNEKGYIGVGNFDGKWGSMTRNSLNAFRADNKVAADLTGADIDRSIELLEAAEKRELSIERSMATVADIEHKSPTIQQAQGGSLWTKITGAAGATSTVGWGLVSAIPDAQGKISPLQSLIPNIPWYVVLGIVVVIAAGISYATFKATRKINRIPEITVDRYQEGGQA